MPVGVPDENRMVGRNRIQFVPRKIPALQQIVEIGADDPLPLRRARRLLLQMRDEFFAGRIFGVADVVEQFGDQRGEDRVAVRIDETWQQRASGEIDDLGVARLEARKRALVADRKHLAALDRERRGDWRARQRTDRPAAQNEVGAFVRCEGGRGPDGGQRGGRGDRIGHERASGGHARRLAEQAGHPAGMELVAKKELVETPAAHIEASRTQQRALRRHRVHGPKWIANYANVWTAITIVIRQVRARPAQAWPSQLSAAILLVRDPSCRWRFEINVSEQRPKRPFEPRINPRAPKRMKRRNHIDAPTPGTFSTACQNSEKEISARLETYLPEERQGKAGVCGRVIPTAPTGMAGVRRLGPSAARK